MEIALNEQADAARKRPVAASAPIGADGEPLDRLDDGRAEARLSAWRAWAQRREPAADGRPAALLRPANAERTPTAG